MKMLTEMNCRGISGGAKSSRRASRARVKCPAESRSRRGGVVSSPGTLASLGLAPFRRPCALKQSQEALERAAAAPAAPSTLQCVLARGERLCGELVSEKNRGRTKG